MGHHVTPWVSRFPSPEGVLKGAPNRKALMIALRVVSESSTLGTVLVARPSAVMSNTSTILDENEADASGHIAAALSAPSGPTAASS